MTIYTPAMPIENDTGAEGALGCFARLRSGGTPVLLSNAHVLFANARSRRGVRIYQPPSSSSCCRNQHLATTLNTWQQGFHRVRVSITGQPIQLGSETDCAIARLQPGIQYTNEHPQLRMITGTPPAGDLGVVIGPNFGTPPTANQLVRLYSPMTRRVHYGTVMRNIGPPGTYVEGGTGTVPDPLLTLASTASLYGDVFLPPINQLMILPRPPPGEGYERYLRGGVQLTFGINGDSGSVVLNHLDQVIGLFAQSPPKPSIAEPGALAQEWRAVASLGLVNPIHRVLDRMAIEIPASFSGTVPTRGRSRVYLPGVDPEATALEEGRDRLLAALSATRFGRFLIGKFGQHRREVRRIVFGVRQALVAWHRHQGPAFTDHLLRNLRDPRHPIPTAINGVSRDDLLRIMADLLMLHGEGGLRRDVARHRELVLSRLSTVTRLDQLPSLVAEVRRPPLARREQEVMEIPA